MALRNALIYCISTATFQDSGADHLDGLPRSMGNFVFFSTFGLLLLSSSTCWHARVQASFKRSKGRKSCENKKPFISKAAYKCMEGTKLQHKRRQKHSRIICRFGRVFLVILDVNATMSIDVSVPAHA